MLNGDPRTSRELVERHHAELYRYAPAMLRDVPAAEDAAQEAFERALVALGRYPVERIKALALRACCTASPQTWLSENPSAT